MKNRKNLTIRVSRLAVLSILLPVGLGLIQLVGFNNAVFAQGSTNQAVNDNQSSCQDINNADECQGLQTINKVLNFMALLVVPVCGVIVSVAGVEYMISRNNPEMASNARMRIYKVILTLIIFAGLWTFLKWLLPGGILE